MKAADIDVAAAATTGAAADAGSNNYKSTFDSYSSKATTLQMSSTSTRAVNNTTPLQSGRPEWVNKFDFLSNMTFTSPGTVIYQPPSVVQLRNAGAVLVDEIAEMYNKLPRIVLRTEIKQTHSTGANTTDASKEAMLLSSPLLSCRSSTMRRPWKPIIRELGDVHNNNTDGITINKSIPLDNNNNNHNANNTDKNNSKMNVNTNYSIDTTLTPEEIESILPPSPMDWSSEIREAVLHRPHDPSEAAYEDDFLRTLYLHHDKAQRRRALRKRDRRHDAPSPSRASRRQNSISSSSFVHQNHERHLSSALSSHSLLEENEIHKDNPHNDENKTNSDNCAVNATVSSSNNNNNNNNSNGKNESVASTSRTAKGLIRRAQFNKAQQLQLTSKVNKKVVSNSSNSKSANVSNTKNTRRVEGKAPNLPTAPRPAKINTSVPPVLESNKNIRVGSVESTSSAAAPGVTSAISPLSYDNNITSISNFANKYYYSHNKQDSVNKSDNNNNDSNTYILHEVEEPPINPHVFPTVQHTRVGSTSHVTHVHSVYQPLYTQSLPSTPQQHQQQSLINLNKKQQHGNAGFIFPVLSSTASELSLRYDVNTSIAESSTCTPTTFDGALSPVSTVYNNNRHYYHSSSNSVNASNSIPRVIIRSGVNYNKILAPGRIEKDLSLLRRRDSASFNLPSTAEQVSLSSSEPKIITLNTTKNVKNANNENLMSTCNNVDDKANVITAYNDNSNDVRKLTHETNQNTTTEAHTSPLGKEIQDYNHNEQTSHLLHTQPLVYSAYGYASLNASKTNAAISSTEQTPNTQNIVIDVQNSDATHLSRQRKSKIVDHKNDNTKVDVKNFNAKDNLVDKATNALKQFVSTLNKQNNYTGNNYTSKNDVKILNNDYNNQNNDNDVSKTGKTQVGENNKATYDRSHTPPKLLRTGRGEGYKYNLACTNILPQTGNNDNGTSTTYTQENEYRGQAKECCTASNDNNNTSSKSKDHITGNEYLTGKASTQILYNKNYGKGKEYIENDNNNIFDGKNSNATNYSICKSINTTANNSKTNMIIDDNQHKSGRKSNKLESEETLPSPSSPSSSLEASSSSILSMLQTHSFKMNEGHESDQAVTVPVLEEKKLEKERVSVQVERSIPPLSLPAQTTNYTDVSLSTILTAKTTSTKRSNSSGSSLNVNLSKSTSLKYTTHAPTMTPDQLMTRKVNNQEREKVEGTNVTETSQVNNIAPTTSNSNIVKSKDVTTVLAADDKKTKKLMNNQKSTLKKQERQQEIQESKVIATNNFSDKTDVNRKIDGQIPSKVICASVDAHELLENITTEGVVQIKENVDQSVNVGNKIKNEMASHGAAMTENVTLLNHNEQTTLPQDDEHSVRDIITATSDVVQKDNEHVEPNTVNVSLTNECTIIAQADKSTLLDTAAAKNNKNFKADDNECIVNENHHDDDSDLNKNSKSKKKKKDIKSGETNYNGQIAIVKTKAACCTLM